MNAKEIFKETIIDNGKTAYNFTLEVLNAVQAQGEKTLNTLLDHTPWIDEDHRKVVDNWLETVKDSQKNVQTVLDENFKTYERLLGGL